MMGLDEMIEYYERERRAACLPKAQRYEDTVLMLEELKELRKMKEQIKHFRLDLDRLIFQQSWLNIYNEEEV